MSNSDKKSRKNSSISNSFLENESFLRNFVNRFFPNQVSDVEDVVQEAYLRAYVAEQKKVIEQPKSFLFSTAKNIALTKLNKKSRQIEMYLDEYPPDSDAVNEPSADELAEARQQLAIYCAAVETLEGKCREAFLLRKVHGLSHREIAKQMSLSVSSIEKYLRKAALICSAHRRQSATDNDDARALRLDKLRGVVLK